VHVIVGVPKEIKNNEFRVGMTPGSVREFVHHGHSVVVEKGAGEGSSFTDSEYAAVGPRSSIPLPRCSRRPT